MTPDIEKALETVRRSLSSLPVGTRGDMTETEHRGHTALSTIREYVESFAMREWYWELEDSEDARARAAFDEIASLRSQRDTAVAALREVRRDLGRMGHLSEQTWVLVRSSLSPQEQETEA